MSEAMDAASGMSKARYQQFLREDENTLVGGGDGLAGAMMAEALGVPLLREEFRAPVHSEIPALFISGTLDGRTPESNAEEVLGGFPNGVHLVIETAIHSFPYPRLPTTFRFQEWNRSISSSSWMIVVRW